jgi:DNA polymerase I-like protein with 3'-5' exonuclease and polymerase domains
MIEKLYTTVDTKEKFKQLLDHIEQHEILAIDIETSALNPRHGEIIGFSVCGEPGVSFYMPTMVFKDSELKESTIENQPCHKLAKFALNKMIGKKLVAHNFAFDGKFILHFYNIDLIQSLYADTMLLAHTVNEEGPGFMFGSGFGLKAIARAVQSEIGLDVEKQANEEQVRLKESIKRNGGSTTKDNYEIWKADLNILSEYGAGDTDLTLRIYNHFIEILKEEGLEKLFFEEEVMPLYKEVTIDMEMKGVKLDMDLLTQSSQDIIQELKKYEDAVIRDLLTNDNVRAWILMKSQEAFPPNHRGVFAQELIRQKNIPFPVSEKTGKFILTASTLTSVPDSPEMRYLNDPEKNPLDPKTIAQVSIKLWKDSNDGKFFNIQSKDQLGEIAFGALGLQPQSFTPGGKPQFDDDTIQSIAETHEWAKNLRIYNRLLKIKSTYMDRFIYGQDGGRYYFYYKQHATVSGRYGSDAQQLPRPKEDGDDDPVVIKYNNLVRAFMIPDEGNVFIDCDYESLEPHVFAHVSGDDGLKDIFRNNWDFYSTIAIKTEKLNQYSPDKKADNYLRKLQPALRNKAKAYALGIPYGMGAYALGKNIGVSTKEAGKLVNGYLDGFPELKKWMRSSEEHAKQHGFVRTQVGRIRHLPKVKNIYEQLGDAILDWNVKRELEQEFGKDAIKSVSRDYVNGLNNAKNVQIQGLAASIVNRAAIAINRKFKELSIKGWVCAQIHDQLVIEVEESRAQEAAKIVQDMMENTTKLSIALKAPPAIAHNMKDGH